MAATGTKKRKPTAYQMVVSDYLRAKAYNTLPQSPVCSIVGRLFYEGVHVGYRIRVRPYRMDVSIEDLERFKLDFSMKIESLGTPVDIILVDKRGKLVAQGHEDAPEATYALLSECYHRKYMEVMDPELKQLYNECNLKYFNGELPFDISVSWSEKMLTSGARCLSTTLRSAKHVRPSWSVTLSNIRVAGNRRKVPREELVAILVHEMIHVKYPGDGHNYVFHQEMKRLNSLFNLRVVLKCGSVEEDPYVYVCMSCGKEYRTAGKMRTVKYCPRCYGKGHKDNGMLKLDRVEK